MLPLKLIAAIDSKNGIAKAGDIPWSLQGDMHYFREMTKYSNVLMGWDTFLTLNKEPLPDRQNFVLTRKHVTLRSDVEVIHNLESFLHRFREDLWVIGGATVFKEAMPYATHLFLTRINHDFKCDMFFPAYENHFQLLTHSEPVQENDILYRFEIWVRK